jgi:hypothetical protein
MSKETDIRRTTVTVTNNSISVNPIAPFLIVVAPPPLSKNTQQCGLYRDLRRPCKKLDALVLKKGWKVHPRFQRVTAIRELSLTPVNTNALDAQVEPSSTEYLRS